MSYKRASNQPVHLPRVPVSPKLTTPQDEFWQQKGTSGAINAFRQLTSTLRRGGRKITALPGGKLQPLFKNDSSPDCSSLIQKNVVPHIPHLGSDLSPTQKQLMCGSLNELPATNPATVRVYLASNYHDMKRERVHLLQTAVPVLQDYCSQLGLQFQLVDLHWGMNIDHDSWETCVADSLLRQYEIEQCQNLSIGPNFVCLLGQKYGVPQLPKSLSEAEYTILLKLVTDKQLNNAEHFSKVYIKDENSIPVVYNLQKSNEFDDPHQLELIIHQTLRLAVSEGLLTQKQYEGLTMSALEEDIQRAIINTKNPRSHCLCYYREFRDVTTNLSTSASTYIDTTTDDAGILHLDTDLHNRGVKLSEGIFEHLGVGNSHSYYLNWTEKTREDFQAYLSKLSEDFLKDVKEMIDIGYKTVAKEIGPKRSAASMVQEEVLFHMHKCTEVISNYTRSTESELFIRLEEFLRDPKQRNKPFVVYGKSGVGKTTTIGIIVQQLHSWFNDCVVVNRFMGITWQSANIHRTLTNITLQICMAYDIASPPQVNFETLHKTLVTFRSVLQEVSKDSASTRPLFIVLDGIDQLHPYQQSLKALWAMKGFPPNVHMIVSLVPMMGPLDLLGAVTSMITTDEAVMEVPPLNEDEIKKFSMASLEESQRKLTETQIDIISKAIKHNPQALYVKQLMLHVLSFTSTDTPESDIPVDVEGLFGKQIEKVELEIGPAILEHFVSFITASPVGILESELVDLLTNNKEVMEEVYMLHFKPSENIFLFPQKLLSRMKLALKDFLCTHLILGRIALAWNHREVYQAASKCYNVIYTGIDETQITEDATNFSLALHEQFVNMFLPECRTTLMCELAKPITDLTSTQLLLHQSQHVSTQNTHKLHRLLTHLIIMLPVEGLTRINESILFNFEWLYTKLQNASLDAIMEDIVNVLQLVRMLEKEGILEEEHSWEEIDILHHFLQLASPALKQDTENLVVEVLGRLPELKTTYPSFCNLIEGAQRHFETSDKLQIVPMHGCLLKPGGELRYTFPGATHVVGFTAGSLHPVMFSQNHGISIWKRETTELLQQFCVNKEQAIEGVIPAHNSPYIVIGHYSHLNQEMEMEAWHVETGVAVIESTLAQKFETLALSRNDEVLFLATTIEDSVNGNGTQKCILGIDARSKEVVCTLSGHSYHMDSVRRMIPISGIRNQENGLISLGGRKSKDLIYWDIDQGAMEYSLTLDYFMDIFLHNESMSLGVGCCTDDGVLLVLDLESGTVKKTLQSVAFRDAQDIYFSISGDLIVIATREEGILLYKMAEEIVVETPAKRLEKDGQTVCKPCKITMDDSEQLLFVGYHSGFIDIYSTFTGQPMRHVTTLKSHTKTINTLHTLENDTLLSASDDEEAILWNYGSALQEHMDHISEDVSSGHETTDDDNTAVQDTVISDSISSLILSQDEKLIITGSYGGPIRLWNIETPDEQSDEISERCEHGVTELYLAYKGKLLIGHCVHPDLPATRILQVWRFPGGEPIAFEQDDMVAVYTSCSFPSDDRLLTISPSASQAHKGILVGIYDLFEMKCLASLYCNIYGNMDCTNLQLLGFTTAPHTEHMDVESIYDSEKSSADLQTSSTEKQYAVLDYFPNREMSFFFTFVIHGEDLKDISMDHHEPIHLDTVSPKCTVIMPKSVCVSGTKDGSIVLWDAATQSILKDFCQTPVERSRKRRREVNSVERHDGPVTCLAAAPDGVHVVSGGADAKVKLWNLMNKNLVHTFTRHTDQILDISVSRANLISSSSMDTTVVVWDLLHKKYLCSFYAHNQVTHVTMTTDKSKMVALMNVGKQSLLALKMSII